MELSIVGSVVPSRLGDMSHHGYHPVAIPSRTVEESHGPRAFAQGRTLSGQTPQGQCAGEHRGSAQGAGAGRRHLGLSGDGAVRVLRRGCRPGSRPFARGPRRGARLPARRMQWRCGDRLLRARPHQRSQQHRVPDTRRRPVRDRAHPPQGLPSHLRDLRGGAVRRAGPRSARLRDALRPGGDDDLRGPLALADPDYSRARRRRLPSLRLRLAGTWVRSGPVASGEPGRMGSHSGPHREGAWGFRPPVASGGFRRGQAFRRGIDGVGTGRHTAGPGTPFRRREHPRHPGSA